MQRKVMISCAVTGTAGFLPGESADPVTAHEIMTLRCMLAGSRGRAPSAGAKAFLRRLSMKYHNFSRGVSTFHAVLTMVNHQWRICFRWTSSGPQDVDIVDYH